MATWKAENSMLTQVGVEILNKIKTGVGSITVTRVVAGSGRVSASQLFQQTAISGTIKPMTISYKDVRDSGSEISIYITNDNFTESFNLNQIGVFVSHPDYEEEQLYHISQCESEGIDVIPALEETPVTFGYSLFLEHGNSSSISITVDPQGIVSIPDFERYKTSVENRIANLTHSDVNAAPYGLIESYIVINSAEDSDLVSKLEEILSEMELRQVRFVTISIDAEHQVIGGGTRVFRIDKVWNEYCTVQALGYGNDSMGVVSEFFRSKYNGVWSSWARTYNTYFKPTHTDIGAAPYGLIYDHKVVNQVSDLSTTLLGWFNSMGVAQIRNFILNVNVSGAPLGGGIWSVCISRVNDNFGTIIATRYTNYATDSGVTIKTCSIHNGNLIAWGTVSSDVVVPASLE